MIPRHLRRRAVAAAVTVTIAGASVVAASPVVAAAAATTTAWHNGLFNLDRPNLVRRSDTVLGSPNAAPSQSLPLGNGSLGVAVWDAAGFTAQLNRSDTLPDRKSPGQVTIPGLSTITNAADFTAHLDLYDGVLTESGAGETAKIYVRSDSDELVVDVTGADPNSKQTAQVGLWSPRTPAAAVSGPIGTLADTWTDNQAGGTGATYGSLAAITAGGRNVTASVVDSRTVKVAFTPKADGSFRVVIGAPTWTGRNAASTASKLIGSSATMASAKLQSASLKWWHGFWAGTDLMKITSADGSGEYLENLRTFYLYQEAGLNRGTGNVPGSQAGVADMYSFNQDNHAWVPADVWWWNARMQVTANMTSGATALNKRWFNLYESNLANIEKWTRTHVPGGSGACVPETMRFNGNGFYGGGGAASNASCDTMISPSWNSQTMSTGAEVSLAIWQQYLMTGDSKFLSQGYPLMKAAAQFLLSQATLGTDGKLHTTANAHETQWHVTDPITDILAMKALFPVVQQTARKLRRDSSFVTQLGIAIGQIPDYPRTDAATHQQLLTASSDAGGQDVLGLSTQPTATRHNGENLDLEATYPYNLIGDNSPLIDLERRSYTNRLFTNNADWSYDALQAARLGLADQVHDDLIANTKKYQLLPSGMANLFGGGTSSEPYNEQAGVVAATLNESLAQDYDGLLRIAPAWPSTWDVDGSVSVQHNSKADLQVRNGAPSTVVLEAGANASMPVRSPWPGQSVQVKDAKSGSTVVAPTKAATFTISIKSGHRYLIEQATSPFTNLPFAQVTGSPAAKAKHLGPVSIGLDASPRFASLAASFSNIGVTDDANTNPGSWDGGGSASFSKQALAAAGATAGGTISHGGLTFTWPAQAGTGSPDNTVSAGQTITTSGSGTLGFLVSASYGPASGTGTIHYTDGSTQSFTLGSPDWFSSSAPAGTDVVISSAYQNRSGNTRFNGGAYVFYVPVTLAAGKTLASVTLPNISAPTAVPGTPALHVFAMAAQGS